MKTQQRLKIIERTDNKLSSKLKRKIHNLKVDLQFD